MSADIGPGDFVECIRTRGGEWAGDGSIRAGVTYMVNTVSYGCNVQTGEGGVFLTLMEPSTRWWVDGHECGWSIEHFRPIRKGGDMVRQPERIGEPA